MVLPEGFALPPIAHSFVLVVATALVVIGLLRDNPPVTSATILGFIPWMAAGGAFHVLYVEHIVGEVLRPLFGTPAVYVMTSVLAGTTWLLASRRNWFGDRSVPGVLASVGTIAFVLPTVTILVSGARRGTLTPVWPLIAIIASVIVTMGVWLLLDRGLPSVASTTGSVGFAAVLAHVFDGISTAVGIDILGAEERSPIPRLIMDVASEFPTAAILGSGWAFVLVKIGLIVGILWLFEPFVRDAPRQAYLLLAAIIAVGLGPGVHNILLFTVAG